MSTASSQAPRRPVATALADRTITVRATRAVWRAEWVVLGIMAVWTVAFLVAEWPALIYETFDSSASSADSAVFGFAGTLLREGGSPYISYWDHKPPLIHLINAAGLALSDGSVWGIWIVAAAAVLAALLLGYWAVRQAFGPRAALLGMACFALALTLRSVGGANLTERYALPLQWAAALLFVRWHLIEGRHVTTGLGLGIIASLAFLLRPNLVGAAVSAGLVISIVLLARRRVRPWLRFVMAGLSGVALFGAATIAYLALMGVLGPFVDQVFHYNTIYSVVGWTQRLAAPYYGLRGCTTYSPVIMPVLAWGGATWACAVYRLWTLPRRDPSYPVLLLGVVWVPVELILACVSGRAYAHYLMTLLAPITFLTAFFASELLRSGRRASAIARRIQPAHVVFVLVAILLIPSAFDWLKRLYNDGLPRKRIAQIAPTARYIRTHSSAGETIFVWGHAADVYFFAQRQPASRFIYPGPLLTQGYADSALVQGFLDELRINAPAIIVDAGSKTGFVPTEALVPSLAAWDPQWRHPDGLSCSPSGWWTMPSALRAFYDYVRTNYTAVTHIGPQRWTIYQRVTPSDRPGP